MSELTFTVDTHLFRELGKLLVGRDSTALVELIKNSYDADATLVTVHGEALDDPENGKIIISDNGTGMDERQFREGFLRIASRLKDVGTRRSRVYKRRFTGAKGVGRLAAHKLATEIEIDSIRPNRKVAISARINWDRVENCPTLDSISGSGAVTLETISLPKPGQGGTTIVLTHLRKRWSTQERQRLFSEVHTFNPPEVILNVPSSVLDRNSLLFAEPHFRDTRATDPGFTVDLTGELEAGEEYFQSLAQNAQWIIEIDARKSVPEVIFNIVPTKLGKSELPNAQRKQYRTPHQDLENGPFFQSRIYVREGVGKKRDKVWPGHAGGIRIYMEGFRVLPYGEPSDDWLSIDSVYGSRNKTLRYLADFGEPEDENEGLVYLGKKSYFGAIFLTTENARTLEMLVNREGFIPDQGFLNLTKTIQVAIDLSVRVRAAAKVGIREKRREARKEATREELRQSAADSVRQAATYAKSAREAASLGDYQAAESFIFQAATLFETSSDLADQLQSEGSVLRVLASVGTQMTAFVHEMNAILGSATALEGAIIRLRDTPDLPTQIRRKLGKLQKAISDLRRSVERHASYLTDVTSADARRRRSRQSYSDRFDAALRLFDSRVEQKTITIENKIPPYLKSVPMFPAELTVIFSNLLSNAIKAAKDGGHIMAEGERATDGVIIRVANTGTRVNLERSEKWFRPFESTTVQTDAVLGQGMGMGLTITRNLVEEYGGTITFVEPPNRYATAIEVFFPD